MEAKKLFFMDCHLAGRKYHDADEAWDKLKVGTMLNLERDKENKYDPDAEAVIYNDHSSDDTEQYLLGYLPREDNEEIAHLLEMGWNNIFECRISKINEEAHPEYQVMLTIKIKRNKNN